VAGCEVALCLSAEVSIWYEVGDQRPLGKDGAIDPECGEDRQAIGEALEAGLSAYAFSILREGALTLTRGWGGPSDRETKLISMRPDWALQRRRFPQTHFSVARIR
jgi:hypothetical protein